MTTQEIKEKMALREEYVVNLLKEDHGNGVSGKTIEDDCNITSGNRQMYMRKLMKKYPQIHNISKGSNSAEYIWVEDLPVKNSEGYSDPTPEMAINTKKEVTPMPGEIWVTVESNGTNGFIFVLNSLNGAAQCIKLYPNTSENKEIIGPEPFEINGYIGDPTHATFKPLRYCSRMYRPCNTGKLMDARKRIAQVFGIKCFTPEVKEVEKKVEVPVEKIVYRDRLIENPDDLIPDGFIDQKSARIAMLENEVEIWKGVAEKLLAK